MAADGVVTDALEPPCGDDPAALLSLPAAPPAAAC